MGLALFALLALAGTEPADADPAFEIRRPPEPPTPDPTWGQGAGAPPLLPVPRKGRECPHPGCRLVVGPAVMTCTGAFGHWHREVKTRRVTLDAIGRPVRRRK